MPIETMFTIKKTLLGNTQCSLVNSCYTKILLSVRKICSENIVVLGKPEQESRKICLWEHCRVEKKSAYGIYAEVRKSLWNTVEFRKRLLLAMLRG